MSDALTGGLALVNQVGMRISVAISSIDEAYRIMRRLGAQGWTSGEAPAGGYILPYIMHDRFDWSLIGARQFTMNDLLCVEHRGTIYKCRTYEAKTGAKPMPAAVKYSRGARPTDSEQSKEGDEDGVQYVTLVTFKGGGHAIPELCVPTSTQANAPAKSAPAATARPALEQQIARIKLLAGARNIALDSDQMRELIRSATDGAQTFIDGLGFVGAASLIKALEALPMPERPAATPKGATSNVTPMPARMLEGLRVALARTDWSEGTISEAIAEVAEAIDGFATYDLSKLSFAAGDELLKLAQNRTATHA